MFVTHLLEHQTYGYYVDIYDGLFPWYIQHFVLHPPLMAVHRFAINDPTPTIMINLIITAVNTLPWRASNINRTGPGSQYNLNKILVCLQWRCRNYLIFILFILSQKYVLKIHVTHVCDVYYLLQLSEIRGILDTWSSWKKFRGNMSWFYFNFKRSFSFKLNFTLLFIIEIWNQWK